MTHTASHSAPARHAASGPGRRDRAPGEAAVWAMLAGVLGTSVAALGLALLGVFRWWAVPPLALLAALALWRLRPPVTDAAGGEPSAFHGVTGPSTPVGGRGAALAVLLIAAATVTLNLSFSSELLQSGRDGGTYTNTAAWLARDGDLVIEARVGPFAVADDLEYQVAGFQQVRAEEDLYPQFIHTFPALMATAAGAFGLGAMLWVNPLLSGFALVAVHALATRFVRPWTGVLIVSALTLNLVFTYYARAPFTEILAMIFVFGGLWTLDLARTRGGRRTALMAGLLLGATTLARLDGFVVTLLVLGLAALGVADRRHREPAGAAVAWPVVIGGALATSAVAAIDTAVYSPFYLAMHTDYLLPLLGAGVALLLGAWVAAGPVGARVWSWADAHRGRLAVAVAVLVVVGTVWGLAVRPELGPATWERTTPIGGLQEAEGQPVDEHRTYGELTMRWLLWYLGPVGLGAAVAGWAGLSARAVRGRARAAVPFLIVLSGMTVLYLWRPSITPDHIWAMRRFLTVSIPGLLIAAGWTVEWLATRLRAQRTWRVGAAALVAVGVLGGSAAATAPVADVAELDGVAAGWDRLCAALGDDAAVLVLQGDFTPWATTQGFRSYCGVPSASGSPSSTRAAELADAWAAEGRRLVIVGSDADEVTTVAGAPAEEVVGVDHSRLEATLTRAPSRTYPDRWELHAAEVAR